MGTVRPTACSPTSEPPLGVALNPVVHPIAWCDPFAAFAPHAERPGAALLHGGDFAILGLRPTQIVTGGFADLAALLTTRRGVASPGFGPFGGGVIGYFGYELGGEIERLPPPAGIGPSLPDMAFAAFDAVAVFDLKARAAAVVAGGLPEHAPDRFAKRARDRAEALAAEIAAAPALEREKSWGPTRWTAAWTRADYEARIRRTLDYIRAGDIFQANIAQRFTAPRPEGMRAFALFRRLCRVNPAPFAAFLCVDGRRAVVSASPERFLRVTVADGTRRVETRPIKGTRPRGGTRDDDARLAAELQLSAKDRAENLIIVDLLRNDLSRTAKVGSVQVPSLWGLESFAAVHHLVSVVTAVPRPEVATLDILRSAFPGGSITGAPKVRAMEIIAELEGARRGPYCGAIGWIGDDGAMDTSITIRTLIVEDDTISVSAGGGIVADSDPAEEYRETLVKAAALLRCLVPDPEILREEGL